MKMAVLHFGEMIEANLHSPGYRISKFVSDELKIPMITQDNIVNFKDQKFDVLFVKYAHYQSSNWELVSDLFHNAKLTIEMQNEYLPTAPKWLHNNRMNFAVWTTIPSNIEDPSDHYINWNVLPWSGTAETMAPFGKPVFDNTLMYYGGIRNGRQLDFSKYMRMTKYHVAFSADPRADFLVKAIDSTISVLPMFKSVRDFQAFGASLYIEDEYSHKVYCSPANRFYECLRAGVAVLVDAASARTLEKAGFDCDESFIVNNADDVAKALPNYDKIRRAQRWEWSRDFMGELRGSLHGAMTKL